MKVNTTRLHFLLFFLPCLLFSTHFSVDGSIEEEEEEIKRADFPHVFFFGAATSAYQIEGAFLEDGKSLNNWDVFCRTQGSIENGDNGDICDDHYHRYLVFDVAIEPFVTIHHHDFPQELEDRYGSWLSPLMQEDFVYFAEICFKSFGDRVKYWMTINEPNLFAEFAYERGIYPPARCSEPFGNCSIGNSDVEPLIAMHNMLLAHGKAAKLYRQQFQAINWSLNIFGIITVAKGTFDTVES
ncbi:hypothetical protein RJ639_031807 [Escallonia herrerae]|uniref:Beta-glucosidase n=1 Tax=Escallonia herrerae TaxID=1293975 RepID=A0AA88X1J7_9ASTE|nr:hypothetical protein RJ639_031807 [Escallonia herrerae]